MLAMMKMFLKNVYNDVIENVEKMPSKNKSE